MWTTGRKVSEWAQSRDLKREQVSVSRHLIENLLGNMDFPGSRTESDEVSLPCVIKLSL